ncbi:MAG: branched-chain amino acid transporter substrate-binding protein [Modestobacter sp.]|jgi:ABC-type branched-subunit amino acid transport system substrate-binding protein|nr:branched-chain amino acid transporter substrate-binding protein [Modestobacter sp.]
MRRSATVALAATTLVLAGCAGTTEADQASGGSGDGEIAAAPGFDPASKTITVAAMYPISGAFANTIQDVVGMRAYFERATAGGGILEGYTVEVESPDTPFDVSGAIPIYQQIKDDVAIIAVLGGFIADGLPLEDDDKLAVVPLTTSTDDPTILPVYPTYETFGANSVAWNAEQEGGQDDVYCTLKMDGPIGDQTEFGVEYAAQELGVRYGGSASFPAPNPSDVTAQIVTLRDAGCTEITVAGVFVMQQAAARAAQLGWEPHWTALGTTYVSDIATGTAADYIQENVSFLFTGSDWEDSSVEGQVDLVEDVESVEPGTPPALVTYETGYITGMVMAAVIRQAIDDGDMSPAGLLAASNAVGNVDMLGLGGGGYDYGSGPDDRQPPRAVTFYEVTDETEQGVRAVETGFTSPAGDSVGLFYEQ